MKTRITYVSPFIEKGRWHKHDAFYLKAAEASEETDDDIVYFVIEGEKTHSVTKPADFRFRAAFRTDFFVRDVYNALGIPLLLHPNNTVLYNTISNHPDWGDVEVPQVSKFSDYIIARPKVIDQVINEKSSLLCYEEYQ